MKILLFVRYQQLSLVEVRLKTYLGGEGDLLSVLLEDAMADPVNMTNPRPVDQAGFETMYNAAW